MSPLKIHLFPSLQDDLTLTRCAVHFRTHSAKLAISNSLVFVSVASAPRCTRLIIIIICAAGFYRDMASSCWSCIRTPREEIHCSRDGACQSNSVVASSGSVLFILLKLSLFTYTSSRLPSATVTTNSTVVYCCMHSVMENLSAFEPYTNI